MEVLQDPSLWPTCLMCQMQLLIVDSVAIFCTKYFHNFLLLTFIYLYICGLHCIWVKRVQSFWSGIIASIVLQPNETFFFFFYWVFSLISFEDPFLCTLFKALSSFFFFIIGLLPILYDFSSSFTRVFHSTMGHLYSYKTHGLVPLSSINFWVSTQCKNNCEEHDDISQYQIHKIKY